MGTKARPRRLTPPARQRDGLPRRTQFSPGAASPPPPPRSRTRGPVPPAGPHPPPPPPRSCDPLFRPRPGLPPATGSEPRSPRASRPAGPVEPRPRSSLAAGRAEGGAGRGARGAEPSRGILLRASAGPCRAARPSEGPRGGGGGEPQTQPGREGSPCRTSRRRRRLRAAPAGCQVPGAPPLRPAAGSRGPVVRSPAGRPCAMQPPPAPRA